MDEFQTNLSLNDSVTIISTNVLEKEAEKLRNIIFKAAENIPKKKVTEYSNYYYYYSSIKVYAV